MVLSYCRVCSFLTAFQFLTSAAIVKMLGVSGRIKVEPLEWRTVKAFLPAVLMYHASIFTNTKVLEYANGKLCGFT